MPRLPGRLTLILPLVCLSVGVYSSAFFTEMTDPPREATPPLVAECYSGGHMIYTDLVHEYYPSPSGIVITPVAGEPSVFVSGDCVIYAPED